MITEIKTAIAEIVDQFNYRLTIDYQKQVVSQGGTVEALQCLQDTLQELGLETLKYHYASPKEVQANLIEQTKDPDQKYDKYPLLILQPSFVQSMEQDANEYLDQATISLLLATNTDPNYKAYQRDLYIFDPILWPIYEALIEIIKMSPMFDISNGRLPHTVQKHYYYSTSLAKDQNVYAAAWDAIEIGSLELKLQTQQECPLTQITL